MSDTHVVNDKAATEEKNATTNVVVSSESPKEASEETEGEKVSESPKEEVSRGGPTTNSLNAPSWFSRFSFNNRNNSTQKTESSTPKKYLNFRLPRRNSTQSSEPSTNPAPNSSVFSRLLSSTKSKKTDDRESAPDSVTPVPRTMEDLASQYHIQNEEKQRKERDDFIENSKKKISKPTRKDFGWSSIGWMIHKNNSRFIALLIFGAIVMLTFEIGSTYGNGDTTDNRKKLIVYILSEIILVQFFLSKVFDHVRLPYGKYNDNIPFTGRYALKLLSGEKEFDYSKYEEPCRSNIQKAHQKIKELELQLNANNSSKLNSATHGINIGTLFKNNSNNTLSESKSSVVSL